MPIEKFLLKSNRTGAFTCRRREFFERLAAKAISLLPYSGKTGRIEEPSVPFQNIQARYKPINPDDQSENGAGTATLPIINIAH
ncbi:MAG: hypothetical protein CME88_02540 [Hirschia sp.]|nr:hypothetical protein [Hirschia sp.]MBF17241.1 hypothetical protein [Hirschia sp.]